MDTMNNLKLVKFGLEFGLIDKDEVIAFAEKEILKEGNPDYFWIEVSMLSEKPVEDLISLIAEKVREPINGYLGHPSPLNRKDMLAIFKLTYQKLLAGSISTEVAMRATIIEFRNSDELLIENEHGEMHGLDYAYCDGIDQGWSSIHDVKRDLLVFLKRYAET